LPRPTRSSPETSASPAREVQGEPRLSLHTEAGINDGLASPLVIIGLFVITHGGTSWLGEWVLSDVLYAVGIASLIGIAAGWLVAVFAAGIAFRRHEYEHEINARIHHGAEPAGRLLAPLIIIVIRPVLVLAITSRGFLDIRGRVFLGFFGVRGVAARFYAATVADTGDLSHTDTTTVVWTTIARVTVSIAIHAISATPLTRHLLR
jgi:NhaP-type Na+/H+ or K+/H+ antiporter